MARGKFGEDRRLGDGRQKMKRRSNTEHRSGRKMKKEKALNLKKLNSKGRGHRLLGKSNKRLFLSLS
jgi:hypothetical protein